MPQAIPAIISAGAGAIMSRKAAKAQKSAEQGQLDAAEQSRQRIEDLSQMTPEELEREYENFQMAKQQQATLSERAGKTGEYLLRDTGGISQQYMDITGREQGLTGEQLFREQGDINKALMEQVLAETRDPGAFYQSTLEPELKLMSDYINRQAQGRGLIRSGLPIEAMGRAGVELAVKEAQARLNARQNALANASTLANRFGGLQDTARGRGYDVMTQGIGARENALQALSSFYQQQAGTSAAARNRMAGGGQAGGNLYMQSANPVYTARAESAGQAAGQWGNLLSESIQGILNRPQSTIHKPVNKSEVWT